MKKMILMTLVIFAVNTSFAAKAMKVVIENKIVSLQSTFKNIELDSEDLKLTDKGQLIVQIEGQEIPLISMRSMDEFTSSKIESKKSILVNILTDKVERDFDLMTCTHFGCLPFPSYSKTQILDMELKTEEGQIVCYKSLGYTRWSLGRCK